MVKPATIRTILFIVVSMKWSLRQVDVNNAFLNGDLSKEVYMQQPPGYVQLDTDGKLLVCRLTRVLYGLRQALHVWFDKVKCFLVSLGFVGSKSDASLFIHVTKSTRMFVLVYVNDIVITRNMPQEIDEFVARLHSEFSLKDMGDLHYFLGIKVTHLSYGCLHLFSTSMSLIYLINGI